MNAAETKPMPLHQLAGEIVRLSERQASTPVLITPDYLSFRPDFFVALSRQLWADCQRDVRFDWFRCGQSLLSEIGTRFSRFQAAKINRALAADTQRSADASIMITATIGRPGGVCRDLVVGLCDDHCELPEWSTPIRIGGSPILAAHLQ